MARSSGPEGFGCGSGWCCGYGYISASVALKQKRPVPFVASAPGIMGKAILGKVVRPVSPPEPLSAYAKELRRLARARGAADPEDATA